MRFPGKCKEIDSVYYTGENEIPRTVGVFPGYYCPPMQISPASAIARSSKILNSEFKVNLIESPNLTS